MIVNHAESPISQRDGLERCRPATLGRSLPARHQQTNKPNRSCEPSGLARTEDRGRSAATTPNAVVGAAPLIGMAHGGGSGHGRRTVEDSKIVDRDADQAVDNRAPSLGESSRKHRKSLGLQPVRECSVKRS
jgi:hypothetical protein